MESVISASADEQIATDTQDARMAQLYYAKAGNVQAIKNAKCVKVKASTKEKEKLVRNLTRNSHSGRFQNKNENGSLTNPEGSLAKEVSDQLYSFNESGESISDGKAGVGPPEHARPTLFRLKTKQPCPTEYYLNYEWQLYDALLKRDYGPYWKITRGGMQLMEKYYIHLSLIHI